jgi:mannose-6-phosphate isomerase-like protein (cupin superfamily)
MAIPKVRYTREQMMLRVARFAELEGYDGGLPDSRYPGSERVIYNLMGFQPPEDATVVSPVGAEAAAKAGIRVQEGFNIGYAECVSGNGPLMHNHDTNETFIPITGKWEFQWEVDGKVESVTLGPLDAISMPAGVNRRFVNVTENADPSETNIVMGIIGGDTPGAEFSEEAMEMLREKNLA